MFGLRYEAPLALSSEEPSRRTAVTRRASTILCYSGPVRFPGVGIPRVRGTAKRQALPPAFMRGEGHAVAGGVLRPQWGWPLPAARCASAEFRFPRYPSQKISPFPIWKRGKITSYCQPSMVLNSCMYFPAGTSQLKSCSMSRRTRLSKAGRFSRYRPMQRLMAARKSSPL